MIEKLQNFILFLTTFRLLIDYLHSVFSGNQHKIIGFDDYRVYRKYEKKCFDHMWGPLKCGGPCSVEHVEHA